MSHLCCKRNKFEVFPLKNLLKNFTIQYVPKFKCQPDLVKSHADTGLKPLPSVLFLCHRESDETKMSDVKLLTSSIVPVFVKYVCTSSTRKLQRISHHSWSPLFVSIFLNVSNRVSINRSFMKRSFDVYKIARTCSFFFFNCFLVFYKFH